MQKPSTSSSGYLATLGLTAGAIPYGTPPGLGSSSLKYFAAQTVTPSATTTHHTTNGTTCSIRATAHGLTVGQPVTLAA